MKKETIEQEVINQNCDFKKKNNILQAQIKN